MAVVTYSHLLSAEVNLGGGKIRLEGLSAVCAWSKLTMLMMWIAVPATKHCRSKGNMDGISPLVIVQYQFRIVFWRGWPYLWCTTSADRKWIHGSLFCVDGIE